MFRTTRTTSRTTRTTPRTTRTTPRVTTGVPPVVILVVLMVLEVVLVVLEVVLDPSGKVSWKGIRYSSYQKISTLRLGDEVPSTLSCQVESMGTSQGR